MFKWVLKTPLKLKIKTLRECHSRCSGVFIVDLEGISQMDDFHRYFTYFIPIIDSYKERPADVIRFF